MQSHQSTGDKVADEKEKENLKQLVDKYSLLIYKKTDKESWYSKLITLVENDDVLVQTKTEIDKIIRSSHLIPTDKLLFKVSVFLKELSIFKNILQALKEYRQENTLENMSFLCTQFSEAYFPINPLPERLSLSHSCEWRDFGSEKLHLINLIRKHINYFSFKKCEVSGEVGKIIGEVLLEAGDTCPPKIVMDSVQIRIDTLVELVAAYKHSRFSLQVGIIRDEKVTHCLCQDDKKEVLEVKLGNMSAAERAVTLKSILSLSPQFPLVRLCHSQLDDQILMDVIAPCLATSEIAYSGTKFDLNANNFTLLGIANFTRTLKYEDHPIAKSLSTTYRSYQHGITLGNLFHEKISKIVNKHKDVAFMRDLEEAKNLGDFTNKLTKFCDKQNVRDKKLQSLREIETILKALVYPNKVLPNVKLLPKLPQQKIKSSPIKSKLPSSDHKAQPTKPNPLPKLEVKQPATEVKQDLVPQPKKLPAYDFKVITVSAEELVLWKNADEDLYDKLMSRHRENMRKDIHAKLLNCDSYSGSYYVVTASIIQRFLLRKLDHSTDHEVSIAFSNLVDLNYNWIHIDILKEVRKDWFLGLKEARLAVFGLEGLARAASYLDMQTLPSGTASQTFQIDSKEEEKVSLPKTHKVYLPKPDLDESIRAVQKILNNVDRISYWISYRENQILVSFTHQFLDIDHTDSHRFYELLCQLESEMKVESSQKSSSEYFKWAQQTISNQKADWDYYMQNKEESLQRFFKPRPRTTSLLANTNVILQNNNSL